MSSQIILKGSHREHPKNSVPAGSLGATQRGTITCVLRRKNAAPRSVALQMSHENFAATHGGSEQDVFAVERFVARHHCSVDRVDLAARTVHVSGKWSDLARAFEANLELRSIDNKVYRTRSGALSVPAELDGVVVSIFGFDERPVAHTRHRVLDREGSTSYTPAQVAKAYNFPSNKGTNQTIALIELGGGYSDSDLKTYWRQMGVDDVTVNSIGVDNGSNSPAGDPDSADGEVALDIEVAGTVAPAARIAVYFSQNTDQSFLNAINAAIHDQVRKPSVISISWGGPEDAWTPQALEAFNAAFHDAALLGITVTAAAGDNGSNDGVGDNANHVDFPAASPWVLACGGTRLQAHNGDIVSETVWNDGDEGGATGGGISQHFAKPQYQKALKIAGRGVPDVAGDADPASGYLVIVDGQSGVVGGTSAVAPLWAALIALFNEALGKNVGWIHPYLYGNAAGTGALHDITSGNNGHYKAAPGWDACTGLGTPDGEALLAILKTALQTKTN